VTRDPKRLVPAVVAALVALAAVLWLLLHDHSTHTGHQHHHGAAAAAVAHAPANGEVAGA